MPYLRALCGVFDFYNRGKDGSPSRIRIVRRISLGMTTLPRSSIRLTIPVAFMIYLRNKAGYLIFRLPKKDIFLHRRKTAPCHNFIFL